MVMSCLLLIDSVGEAIRPGSSSLGINKIVQYTVYSARCSWLPDQSGSTKPSKEIARGVSVEAVSKLLFSADVYSKLY